MTTIVDIEELASKLLSDKSKFREEGIKLLSSYLDAADGCMILDQQTVLWDHQQRIPSATWPGVLRALCQCITTEVVSSKKRGPKPILAKVFRCFVQKAEDSSRSGKSLFLQRTVKGLFRHMSEIILEVPSFLPDYSQVLRQLLEIKEYRVHMPKKVFLSLLHFYLDKAKTLARGSTAESVVAKEAAFRNTITLYCLLQYPPGNFSKQLREDLVGGLSEIFVNLRDEGRIAKKLLAALNAFLVNDGLNLGDSVVAIHTSIRDFMIRTWLTTHDRELKDGLVLYARIQLKLRSIVTYDEGGFVQQMVDLVEKELDQNSLTLTGMHRFDGGGEDKAGAISKSLRCFFELAASVLHEGAAKVGSKVSAPAKRQKKDHIFVTLKDRIIKGKFLWAGAFCLLIRRYHMKIAQPFLWEWLDGLSCNLDRVLADSINTHSFESAVWFLRCLQELSAIWPSLDVASEIPINGNFWKSVWSSIIHWLPLLSGVQAMVEEAFKLLSFVLSQDLLPVYIVPQDFWDLSFFSELPFGSLLLFLGVFFSTSTNQITVGEDIEVRKKLLKWSMSYIDFQDLKSTSSWENYPMLISVACLALSIGFVHISMTLNGGPLSRKSRVFCLFEELKDWAKPEEQDLAQEAELEDLDRSEFVLAASGFEIAQVNGAATVRNGSLPFSISHTLVREMADHFISKIPMLINQNNEQQLIQCLNLSTILVVCILGVVSMIQRRGREFQDWCVEGKVWQGLLSILTHCLSIVDNLIDSFQVPQSQASPACLHQKLFQTITPQTSQAFVRFLASLGSWMLIVSDGVIKEVGGPLSVSLVLQSILLSFSRAFKAANELLEAVNKPGSYMNSLLHPSAGVLFIDLQSAKDITRIIDSDLDANKELLTSNAGGMGETGDAIIGKTGSGISYLEWKLNCVLIVASFAEQLPNETCDVLVDLLNMEKDLKIRKEILLHFCKSITPTAQKHIPFVVNAICEFFQNSRDLESGCFDTLTIVDSLVATILGLDEDSSDGVQNQKDRKHTEWQLSQRVLHQLVRIVADVAEAGFMLWPSRRKLADTISNFILMEPYTAQALTEKLLVLLHDPEYRVRLFLSKRVPILFQTWTGHEELFQDVCCNFGLCLVMATRLKVVTVMEASTQSKSDFCIAETIMVTLGELAATSEKVEEEAVFMICAHAALNRDLRPLISAVLDRLAKRLQYPNRWKYLGHVLGAILCRWVKAQVPLPVLVEIKDLLVWNLEPVDFLQHCCPMLLPHLLMKECESDLVWLAKVASESISALVKQHFVTVFAALLPIYCGDNVGEREEAVAVLQGSMLVKAEMSEDERDELIKKHMVLIVNSIIQSCSSMENPQLPFFPKLTVISAVKTVVDGFLESDDAPKDQEIVDRMQIFRPDRVFMFILQLHFQIESACHPRHRRDALARLDCLIDILNDRVAVRSTCRYLFHVLLLSMEMEEMQEVCCCLIGKMLDILTGLPEKDSCQVLGEQLHVIIPKLVTFCLRYYEMKVRGENECISSSLVLSLLDRFTVNSGSLLHGYLRELLPFPDIPTLESVRLFHTKLSSGSSLADDFVQFVAKMPGLPPQLQLRSLQCLHRKLGDRGAEDVDAGIWSCSQEVVSAAWKLVQLCFKNNVNSMEDIAGDFIAQVGIGDPHAVIFHLPDAEGAEASSSLSSIRGGVKNVSTDPDEGVCHSLVKFILFQLQAYLMDASVNIIEVASQTLKGLLSTEKGHRVFKTMTPEEKAYLDVFSRGVNDRVVEKLLNAAEDKYTLFVATEKSVALEDDTLWETSGKSYDSWVCTLVYSLIRYTEDVFLRLCQGLVYSKAFLAEAIFPHVLGNLAAKAGTNTNICRLISTQVEKHVFCDKNNSIQSIQLFLEALNELRRCHVLSRMKCVPELIKKKDTLKGGRSNLGGRRTIASTENDNVDATLAVRAILNYEKQCIENPSTWEKVYWLQIDYLKAARSAQKFGAYFTSILYIEHWCEEKFGVFTQGKPDLSEDEELSAYVDLLLSVYTGINEPDGVYGVTYSHKLIPQILTHEHEGNWSRAMECYDLLLRRKQLVSGVTGGGSNLGALCLDTSQPAAAQNDIASTEWKYNKGLMKCLQQTGCLHVLEMYRDGLSFEKSNLQKDVEFQELQYESAWRVGQWDFFRVFPKVAGAFQNLEKDRGCINFHAHLYSCLRSLHEGDAELFGSGLKQAKQELVNFMARTSLESTKNVHPFIIKLQVLYSLSRAWHMRWRLTNCQVTHSCSTVNEQENTKISGPYVPSTQQVASLNVEWQQKCKKIQSHYDLLEPFVAFQKVLFQILECREFVPQRLLEFATFARKGGRFNQAAIAIHELKLICHKMSEQVDGLSKKVGSQMSLSTLSTAARIQEAKILWAQGQHGLAVNLAKYIIEHYDIKNEAASVHCLAGKWLAETRSGSSRIILDHYLKKAVELADNKDDTSQSRNLQRCQTYYRLAHYADSLYRSYEERLSSSEWQAALRLRHHKARELEVLMRRLKNSLQDEKRDYTMKVLELQRQLAMDNEEAQRLQDDRDSFLSIALDSYRSCLAIGDKYDVKVVFRATSLWFNLSTNQRVVEAMLETVKEVKSFKFLPLVYQIASRLGGSKESQGPHRFQFALAYLLKKMAVEHPYHTIYQLLALANGDRVKDKQRSKSAFVVDLDKKHAAEDLLDALAYEHGNLIQQMKQMVELYIKLAELEVRREDANKKISLPRDMRSLRELELVPVITAPLPVDHSCQYPLGYFPHFKGLCDRIIVMNGINAPKVVECLGSNGHKYRQLAKSGNDDLRQDAVMEQLFGLVNTLLQHHPSTHRRKLCIRTYKVIPFTPSAGVLEWVDGTIPLGEYLLGSTRTGGAHGRYGVGDWTFPMCREHMTIEKEKRKAFQRVCENFRPVLHYFFLEKFSQPAEWFEKRLAYTRSVATSSMVGYIVGLGDRHSMNILIDQASAEVVHIDLGVAFEQGLMLKTPERVPFRLTRDLVDGMGITGVEGVFRRCSEETISVMRTNKEALLTIIEVFIHDPLYKWALSPLKALERQKETSELDDDDEDDASEMESSGEIVEGNKDAARALLRVKEKLDGYEGGDMRSVQGQVQQLLQDAQDSEKLCQMFPGWGAWL